MRSTGCGNACLFLVIAILASRPSYAAVSLPDDQITNMIVGAWMADIGQPDAASAKALELEKHALTNYYADGSAMFRIYSDVSCKSLIKSVKFSWAIKDGIMDSRVNGRSASRDEVVELGQKTMTLRLLSGNAPQNLIQHRVRAQDCSTPE